MSPGLNVEYDEQMRLATRAFHVREAELQVDFMSWRLENIH